MAAATSLPPRPTRSSPARSSPPRLPQSVLTRHARHFHSATAHHTGATETLPSAPEYNPAKQIECAVDMHVDARMCDVWNYFIIFAP